MPTDDIDPATRKAEAAALKALFDAQPLSQAAFGRRFDIGGQSMVSQYLTAYRPLNLAAAINFAKGLRVSVEDFSPRLAFLAAGASSGASPAQLPTASGEIGFHLQPFLLAIAAMTPGQWEMVKRRLDDLPGHPEANEDVAADVLPLLAAARHAKQPRSAA